MKAVNCKRCEKQKVVAPYKFCKECLKWFYTNGYCGYCGCFARRKDKNTDKYTSKFCVDCQKDVATYCFINNITADDVKDVLYARRDA